MNAKSYEIQVLTIKWVPEMGKITTMAVQYRKFYVQVQPVTCTQYTIFYTL